MSTDNMTRFENENAETRQLMVSAFFLSFPITPDYTMLMHQTRLEANLLVNQSTIAVLHQFDSPRCIYDLSDPDEQDAARILYSCGYLVETDTPEPDQPQTELEELSIWLHLTGACNFRCTYCYLPHPDQIMTVETGIAAIEKAFAVAEMKGFTGVQIKYSGGEPLLHFPLVLTLHGHANLISKQKGLQYTGIVLSNGALLDERIINRLLDHEIRLMVSLDSLGDEPNPQRVWKNGQPTSPLVCKNIELALTAGLKPQISITISSATISVLPNLVDWILERGLVFSFNFFRDNTYAAKHHSGLIFSDAEMVTGLKAAFERIEAQLPDWNLLASLADRSNLSIPHVYPCGVGQNYLVFDSTGVIYACHMDMNHPAALLTDANPFYRIQTESAVIQNISILKHPDCRECPWRFWCAGGCPYLTQRVFGDVRHRSPYCGIYQALFPEIIRLEALRLIRQIEA